MLEHRAVFDFEIDFSNGGAIQGQGFRLDIDGNEIGDDELVAYIIRDLRLLMVGEARILNKCIVTEAHKRRVAHGRPMEAGRVLIDLSHTIESGMVTYKGLPAPLICDHLSYVASYEVYADGTEFQIGRIDMVANTGTYVDVPSHRYRDGDDLAHAPLDRLSALPGVVVRVSGMSGRAIDWQAFAATDVASKAILVQTDWDRHWRTDQYFEGHPYLTAEASTYLRDQGALLVGIDSLNIDDTDSNERPVHSTLLAAGIPIVEHLTNLGALPVSGFTFNAVPPKVAGMGTFPVRAHAVLDPMT
ncbi:MAG: cyclase family protein [Sulfitobacter dubius]|uniref:cyclase family protein n=1 Tax=Roseibium sp. TaxID=1936156 RepID=UPI0032995548